MRPLGPRRALRSVLVAIVSLAGATLAVGVLERVLAVPDASIVYVVAVVAVAAVAGPVGAILVSIASFLLYDLLFTVPYLTLGVSSTRELLSVVLLLFVGIVVGQLAARQRSRADEARAREREARALFGISRALATRESTPAVLGPIARLVREETGMQRIWIALGTEGSERIAVDTADEPRPTLPLIQRVLRRMPGDEPARWLRVHQPAAPKAARPAREVDAYRVRIEAGVDTFGWLWAVRTRGSQEPDRTQTRLLSAAADQLGQALAQDRLAAEAQASEIARRSDDLRSALLQSVSHDLRTPLGTIRAAAGTLRPTSPLNDHERAESAAAIEREVEYLNRLVTNLLDLSRIEAGVLRPERDVFDLDDLAGRTIERLRPRLEGHPLEWAIGPQPVDVDPIFVDEALTNAIENVVKHTPPGTPIRIVSQALDGERLVRLTVEDAGPGVPDGTFERLFERFYRTPRGQGGSRAGTGIGLAVARGLVEATGGRVGARRSELGGLAVDFDLPIAIVPADLAAAR